MRCNGKNYQRRLLFPENNLGTSLLSASTVLILYILSTLATVECQTSGLKLNFYQTTSCPNAETIARTRLQGLGLTDPTAFAALLRLLFHDCAVQGCDASIMLDSNSQLTSELVANENFGIRRLNFIDQIKSALESACPGVVSCADIIAMAARDAISLSGGPTIPILTGRRDSLTASNKVADASLLPATVTVDKLLSTFGAKGISTQESVALLGAHTLGVGHCINIVNRLYPTLDPNLPAVFAMSLRLRCPFPRPITNISVVNLDLTNLFFDNRYFKDSLGGTGVFTIDSELALDARTRGYVAQFAQNQQLFFQVFGQAFLKLTQINVLTGTNGQIRTKCHAVNVNS